MKNKNFIRGNHAVAGVIEALLLVALVAIILSTIQLLYIPQVMNEREADHMEDVSNQFSYLKSVIDTQSLLGSMETDVPLAYVPMTSPITLGSRELPYFVTARAFGELSIINDEELYNITVFPELLEETSGDPKGIFPLTSIKYVAYNSYFVDQTYVLEGGGIILDQPTGEPVMRVNPSISVEDGTKINIRFYLPKIIGTRGKNSTSGYENGYVRTNYSMHETYSGDIPNGGYIKIYTDYLNAWNDSLYSILGKYVEYGYISITLLPLQSPSYVEIRPDGKEINLELTIIDIKAQISPGWVIP